ncbi:MAG: O-antigen ligase family protein [Anaerolineae bacterium]|nr:O-antigen ligase family protein [Anaerolineae bacterium]
MIYTFWFHSPPIRDEWVWLFWLAIPIFRLRMHIRSRLWVETPLNNLLIAFILLTAFNFATAPFSRSDYLVLISRPLLGMWLFVYFTDHAATWKTMQWLALATVGMSLLVGVTSLTTTVWETSKSADLTFIIEALPRFDWRAIDSPKPLFPPIQDMGLGFNPNEVAGALAFVIPLMAAFAIGSPQSGSDKHGQNHIWLGIRVMAAIAFAVSMISLIVGQSRFAIAGVIGALSLVVFLLISGRIWKFVAAATIAIMVLFQAAIFFNLFAPVGDSNATVGISSRDQNTFSTRFELWESATRMMLDYPLTGTGMSMFRTATNQEAYRIDYYVQRGTTPPHAHNEWLQIGADLGIPGFLMFVTMQPCYTMDVMEGLEQSASLWTNYRGSRFWRIGRS